MKLLRWCSLQCHVDTYCGQRDAGYYFTGGYDIPVPDKSIAELFNSLDKIHGKLNLIRYREYV